jgi:hypothetical protein
MVLFMSGYPDLKDQDISGPLNFLAKPFAPRTFAEKVGNLLGTQKRAAR